MDKCKSLPSLSTLLLLAVAPTSEGESGMNASSRPSPGTGVDDDMRTLCGGESRGHAKAARCAGGGGSLVVASFEGVG